jgi:hypothetical protein
VPGLLVFSLRLLAEALLVAVRGVLGALGLAGTHADRYEPARAEPEPVPEPAPVGGASVGAQVHVAEPWPGYDEMRLDEVLARLQSATEVELAIVRAYEREHDARQAVLLAAGEPA